MKYYSTAHRSEPVTLRTAVLRGIPEDRGLYMPENIPLMPKGFFENIHHLQFREIATSAALTLLGEDLPSNTIIDIIDRSLDFDIPLVMLDERFFILELFHGPTLAFKDIGARFMARLMEYYFQKADRELTILTATSGDTGSAVADAFQDVEGVRVILLYPSGKISRIQEQQICTRDGNITALEIKGSFDDCQKMVKHAFQDKDLREKIQLSSANSINLARLLPQSFYYFYACAQLQKSGLYASPVVSVPSGNLGNLTAGLIAKRMGLPVKRFIAACNLNDSLPRYLQSGKYESQATVHTISNAMDVGDPSNFSRIEELYEYTPEFLRKDLYARSFNDDQTRDMIRKVYHAHRYVLDPHSAVAVCGIKNYQREEENGSFVIALETAHPAKFRETVEDALNIVLKMPQRLKNVMDKVKKSRKMSAEYDSFKEYLLSL